MNASSRIALIFTVALCFALGVANAYLVLSGWPAEGAALDAAIDVVVRLAMQQTGGRRP